MWRNGLLFFAKGKAKRGVWLFSEHLRRSLMAAQDRALAEEKRDHLQHSLKGFISSLLSDPERNVFHRNYH